MSKSSAPLDYRRPNTPAPPGPLTRWWLRPLPWSMWCMLLLAPIVLLLLLDGIFNPVSYYLFPFLHLLLVMPITYVALIGRLASRHNRAVRHGIDPRKLKSERYRAALALVLATSFLVIPLPLVLGVAMRYSALESLRNDVAAGVAPAGPVNLFPLRLTDTELYENGIVILYTEGGRGAFPVKGSGFLYLPEGIDVPPYNVGGDGRLLGRWHWFTTD